MSFTIKPELHQRPSLSGERSLHIRISHKKKRARISVGKSINPKHWDQARGIVKPSHPLSVLINESIRKLVYDAERIIFEHKSKGDEVTLDGLVRKLKGATPSSVVFNYAMGLTDRLEGKFAEGSVKNLRIEAERVNRFHPGITFERIDVRWLSDYEKYLRDLEFTHNTVHKCFKTLAKFFNSAIREGLTTNYPFRNYDRPRYRQGDRTYLTSFEIDLIEQKLIEQTNPRIKKAIAWFLFGCYSGLRFSDWKRFDQSMIRGSELILRAKKNGQLVVMPIHSRLQKAIDLILQIGQPEAEQNTNVLLKAVAAIAGIDKNLTTHVARHSFAVRCAELGISIETTAELMGINVKTCQIYYKVTGTKVKKEMEKWG